MGLGSFGGMFGGGRGGCEGWSLGGFGRWGV